MSVRYKLRGHEQDVIESYQAGQPTTEIARRFDVSATSVNQLLKKLGVPRRDSRTSHPLKEKCRYGHLLSGENLYTTKRGNRGCRACRKAWSEKHPQTKEQYERSREWLRKKLESEPQYRRNVDLWTLYRISRADFDAKLVAQQNCCMVCKKLMEKPHVDHDHATFQVRDLVCRNCNLAIGFLNEDIATAERLVSYLQKWKSNAAS